ncbi:MAG TPA: Stp1/IreP family PP2C-type Ser/Thr phosphatase [Myxococcales bacterium]|nr:serine/threonine protein phosphatase [Deltaproteobacteria bacterium]MBU49436.1 serine/threonine protein phosphatase [Deltaproteobacteria bacterium]HAA57342.1 Stp1/IreP family PP2C-type Ser/Thr phosphatase [Myxococcales bacterium]
MKASDRQRSPIGRCTDVGRIRAANEDSMGDLPIKDGHVLIVADGMGGYRGGALASHLVVEAIEEYFRDADIEHPQKALRQAIYLANERIYLRGQQDEELSRMGSTCVLAMVQGDLLHLAHVGDSRIYILRDTGQFQQLTRDHTVVQHFVDVGLLSQEEAKDHPDSHILSRALGPRAHVEPDVCDAPLQLFPGDRVVLCSDGLTKMIEEEDIESFVQNSASAQAIAEKLVAAANESGGEDNITVIVFEYMNGEGKVVAADNQAQKDIDPLGDTPPFGLPAADDDGEAILPSAKEKKSSQAQDDTPSLSSDSADNDVDDASAKDANVPDENA